MSGFSPNKSFWRCTCTSCRSPSYTTVWWTVSTSYNILPNLKQIY